MGRRRAIDAILLRWIAERKEILWGVVSQLDVKTEVTGIGTFQEPPILMANPGVFTADTRLG
jgi:hypothetical protein